MSSVGVHPLVHGLTTTLILLSPILTFDLPDSQSPQLFKPSVIQQEPVPTNCSSPVTFQVPFLKVGIMSSSCWFLTPVSSDT